MPRMHILTPAEYAAFETPPVFTTLERQRFFDLPPSLEHLLGTFRTPTNQLCFVLTLGYFKATNRFFARQFHDPDAIYVARQLGGSLGCLISVRMRTPPLDDTARSFWTT